MDREPEPLRSDARRLLAVWRDADDMPADARARVEQRLLHPTPATVVPLARARTWTIVVALAAAVLLAWWLGGLRDRSQQATREVSREQAADRTTPPSPGPAVEITPAELPPPTPTTPSIRGTTEDREVPSEPAARRVQREPAAPSDAASVSTLAREKALIQQAWQTLAAGDPRGALAVVDTHAREFPEGVLAPERRAVTLVARCKRGDADATERAQAWLDAAGRSPHAARVRAACNLEAP